MLLVPGLHFGHEVGGFLVGDGWGAVVVIIVVEEHGEHVGDSLALGVAHGVDGCVCTLGKELVLQAVAPAIASDDAAHFPELEVVKEFTAMDAYLAYDELVDVVGGSQFFAFLPFLLVLVCSRSAAFCSLSGRW